MSERLGFIMDPDRNNLIVAPLMILYLIKSFTHNILQS